MKHFGTLLMTKSGFVIDSNFDFGYCFDFDSKTPFERHFSCVKRFATAMKSEIAYVTVCHSVKKSAN